MVVKRHSKRKWRRGHRTYHGSHKKWRGGGSRGGRGKAGMHKHKWSYTVKYEPEHFGKEGFKKPKEVSKKAAIINLEEIDKLAEKEKLKEIDLSQLGYEKVLGKGKLTQALTIKAKYFSKSAIKKIEQAGGRAVKV
ncbi:MAG: uL15m family ribosomal protein [Candidatus Aenigmatarchaeota archaeon]